MGGGGANGGIEYFIRGSCFFFFFETRLLFRVFLFSYVLLKY